MARLVPFSLAAGTVIEIRGVRYRSAQVKSGTASVQLIALSDDSALEISRNELAALIVTEEARICDELEEPEPHQMRTVTDISMLSAHRMFDWQFKIFLCKWMTLLTGQSPKSKSYKAMFLLASGFLQGLYPEARPTGNWSAWTIYHDLLRWRASGYDFAAFQRKGVEYAPWSDNSKARITKLRQLIEDILSENPNFSASAVHEEVNKRLKGGI